MSKIRFTGIMSALVTPLDRHGRVNTGTVKSLVDDQLAAGVDGFYVAGGTGEGVLLTVDQRKSMAEAAISACAGRGKIIVHTGSINSSEVMELTRHATGAGADGISSVLPSIYFRYTIGEIVDFYREMAAQTHLPVLIYANHTGDGTDVNRMLEELLTVENIVGAKDTRANYFKMWQLKQLNGGDINVINGPDESLLCGLAVGADGGIGATYNLMPQRFVELYRKFQAGDLDGAREVQSRINRVVAVILGWAEGNCIRTVKETLRLSGYEVGSAIYPAREYTSEKSAAFRDAMLAAGYPFPA